MSLNNQPYEILLMIFNHLDDNDILSISQLNPYYHQIANHIAKDRLTKKNVKLTDRSNYAKLLNMKINSHNITVAIIKDDVDILQYLMDNNVNVIFNDIYLHIIKFHAINVLKMLCTRDNYNAKVDKYNQFHDYPYLLSFTTVEMYKYIMKRFQYHMDRCFLERCINNYNYDLSYYISSCLAIEIDNCDYSKVINIAYRHPDKRYLNIIINLYSINYGTYTISSLLLRDHMDVTKFITDLLSSRKLSYTDILMNIIDQDRNHSHNVIKFFIDNYDIDKIRPLKYFIIKEYYTHEYNEIYNLLLDDTTIKSITHQNIWQICSKSDYDNNLFKLLVRKGVNIRFDNDAVFNGLLCDVKKHYLCKFLIDSNIGITADAVTPFTVETVIMKNDINHIQFLIDIGVWILDMFRILIDEMLDVMLTASIRSLEIYTIS